MKDRVTRLAPSPTGALHLGNARSFLINWALARQSGWRVVMRIEDLDGPRLKAGADRGAIQDLQWLGMDWDGQPTYQSHDMAVYQDALKKLADRGLTYACPATRKEIEAAASAPHLDQHETRYPNLYRPPHDRPFPADAPTATRLIVPDGEIAFTDEVLGPQSVDVQGVVGDFIVETKAGLPSYQLAVVVDDARQGVTDVVRGDDLLGSTARQILLYRLLELGEPPRYWHLPLVLGQDGHRLAKRHGDTRVGYYREQGVRPERVIGLIAKWSGVTTERLEMSSSDFATGFDLAKMPRDTVTFTKEDDQWLRKE